MAKWNANSIINWAIALKGECPLRLHRRIERFCDDLVIKGIEGLEPAPETVRMEPPKAKNRGEKQ